MGREANCVCRVGGASAAAKALLETEEIILRGALKRRYAFAALSGLRVEDDVLCFEAAGETVALHLGTKEATAWARHIAEQSIGARSGIHFMLTALRSHANLVSMYPVIQKCSCANSSSPVGPHSQDRAVDAICDSDGSLYNYRSEI